MSSIPRWRPDRKKDFRLPHSLDRRFEAVVFDWDGTAVPDRGADATPICARWSRSCARSGSTWS